MMRGGGDGSDKSRLSWDTRRAKEEGEKDEGEVEPEKVCGGDRGGGGGGEEPEIGGVSHRRPIATC